MGSKSSSNQTQQTTSNNTQQSFVDNSRVDNSDNSRVDIWQDYSDNSRVDIDNSDNSRTDIYQDYSDNSRVDIDNSDNSRTDNQGVGAGAIIGGNLSVIDGGAFDVVGRTVDTALRESTEQTYLSVQGMQRTAQDALNFGRDAVLSNENVSLSALDNMAGTTADSIAGMISVNRASIDGMADGLGFAVNAMMQVTEDAGRTTTAATQAAIQSSNDAMERNAALIQTTALGGQDLVIDMAKKVSLGAAAALAVGAVAVAVVRAK